MARRGGKDSRETSYDEDRRRRFGTGGGVFGFGAGGRGLPWVFLAFCIGLLLVVGRLFYLQVLEGPHLAAAAEERRTSARVLQARRGTIYDRNGNVLAMSEECYDVYCNPKEITNAKAEAAMVARWLGGTASAYEELFAKDSTFVYLVRKADKEASEGLRGELLAEGYAGVYLISQMQRVYPYGKVCGQVLGMVDVDGNGISGLELAYDEELGGTNGELVMETGLGGVPIAGAVAQLTEPTDGKDLILSVDVDVQKYVEDHIEAAVAANKAKSGFAMVCDPRTGSIIAACSTPYADLTDPQALTNESLNLKMVSDSYDPGSIFKVLTSAIGLESGTVKTSDYFTVPPTILVGKDIVSDEDGRMETMEMNLREILRRSSNVGAVLVADEAIGAEAFAAGVSAFGIGEVTGIDYPGETAGIVKELKDYDPSTLGSMSFGQGLSIPMVQMVRAVGAIANGGKLLTPHFAQTVGGDPVKLPQERQAISVGTAEKVADMMRTVVEDGTGTTAAVEGYDVAAKTGTGEQAENGKYIQGKYLASLIGFAPAQTPEVLLYVGLNETPHLSYSSAGPVFSAIMGEVLADMGVLSSP